MITFHPSANGARDYLDFHTTTGDRFYLGRAQARELAREILAATGDDVACPHCGLLNGTHTIYLTAAGLTSRCPSTQP